MVAAEREYIEERLKAYILPRKAETQEQLTAFRLAADAQEEWENANGTDGIPGNVSEISNDGVSMRFSGTSAGQAGYSRETLCPAAWAYLRNAGLIAYALPTAKKP